MTSTTRLRQFGLFAASMGLAAFAFTAQPLAQEGATQKAKETARQSGNAIKDSWITMKIHSMFVPEDALSDSDIDVDTNNGVVTLTGTVVSDAGKLRAAEIAKTTDGVKSVTNNLRIVAAGSATASAREAGRDAAASTKETARSAGKSARDATGTTGRAVSDGWIKSKIYAQFITEDALDDADVDVDSRNGVVTLKGTVPTEAARTRAAGIAKATDGVKSVTNSLKVTK